jgi:CBS domain-containing protein
VDLIIAQDIAVPPKPVTPADSLLMAINVMVKTDRDELVVVEEQDRSKIVGTISRSDIIACYNRQIATSHDPISPVGH